MLLPLLDMNVNRILLQQTLDLYAASPWEFLFLWKKKTLLVNCHSYKIPWIDTDTYIQLQERWGHDLTFIFNWYLKTYDIRAATIIFKKRHRLFFFIKTLLHCIYIPGDFVMPWIKMKKCIWNLCWRLYLSKNRELHSLSAEVIAASEAFCMPDAQFFLK